jgi:thiol:disulfide interchange protein DsbC
MIRVLIMIVSWAFLTVPINLGSHEDLDDSGQNTQTAEKAEEILAQLSELFPKGTDIDLRQSPIDHLYTVRVGSQVFYVSGDGRHLISGDLYDTASNENITELERQNVRLDYINLINPKSMITFSPSDYQHTVTIFTDIDCGYCRKFHQEIEGVMEEGIRVQYISFPRGGPESDSWYKAQKVWCSENRQQAITQAKQGKELLNDLCSSDPVQEHYNLGLKFNVRGTPTMLTDKGEIIVGYMSAARLRERLDNP